MLTNTLNHLAQPRGPFGAGADIPSFFTSRARPINQVGMNNERTSGVCNISRTIIHSSSRTEHRLMMRFMYVCVCLDYFPSVDILHLETVQYTHEAFTCLTVCWWCVSGTPRDVQRNDGRWEWLNARRKFEASVSASNIIQNLAMRAIAGMIWIGE